MSARQKTMKVSFEEDLSDNRIQKRDDAQFRAEVDSLIAEGEALRLRYMRMHSERNTVSMTLGVFFLILGAVGFSWFFFLKGNLFIGLLSILTAMALPLLLMLFWVPQPIKYYKRDYKKVFLPKLARAFGGLKFFASRGISSKVLKRSGIAPVYDEYRAEDCFMGLYKGVKVIFCEAQLFVKKDPAVPIFDGILVLLEIPQEIIEGHTIITSDMTMAGERQNTMWSKLKPMGIDVNDKKLEKFKAFSDHPETAELFIGERFLTELNEASNIFNNAHLSAVLFNKKYIFMMIPHKEDMFEASEIYLPVATHQHATKCKKEIEKIMEIVDLFELYKDDKTTQSILDKGFNEKSEGGSET